MEYPGCPGGQTRPLGPADIIIGALMGAGGPTLVGVGDGGGGQGGPGDVLQRSLHTTQRMS